MAAAAISANIPKNKGWLMAEPYFFD